MHAFLVIGNNASFLAKKLGATLLEFPINKIEDTRNLANLTRVSFTEKTLIVCRDIHTASNEALNSFLKNLEEPQPNIYYALTTTNISLVMPTIVSRCQVIKHANYKQPTDDNKQIEEFLNMSTGKKLQYLDKIKDRTVAIQFLLDLIYKLQKENKFNNMETILKTHSRLKANGNVNLQLANLAIQFY